jgi:hypothetical protein
MEEKSSDLLRAEVLLNFEGCNRRNKTDSELSWPRIVTRIILGSDEIQESLPTIASMMENELSDSHFIKILTTREPRERVTNYRPQVSLHRLIDYIKNPKDEPKQKSERECPPKVEFANYHSNRSWSF